MTRVERPLFQRAHLWLLRWAVGLADRIGGRGNHKVTSHLPHGKNAKDCAPGISIVIPERANPCLLEKCIASVEAACVGLTEPFEIIVVVSGSPQTSYSDILSHHPQVRWMFFRKPLWFSGAVRSGIRAARFAWVYLLNNDMTVDPGALQALLHWRAPHVFAISSQIYFSDLSQRREETGWTAFRADPAGPIEIFDAMPLDDTTVRGNFYAGGGASLFRRNLLADLIRDSAVYDPFYWEDVEWGTRAWRRGYQILFCPASIVWHEHRATNRKFFPESEIDRIMQRNRLIFHFRNDTSAGSLSKIHNLIDELNLKSLLEITEPRRLCRIFAGRVNNYLLPFRDLPLEYTWQKYYFRSILPHPAKPVVVVVCPYAIYPPSHGGARRIQSLIEALARDFDIVLLSDEADLYSQGSFNYFLPLASVHLVGGRVEGKMNRNGRIERIDSHSHFALAEHLRFLIAANEPNFIQIEFVELSKLVELRKESGCSWFLTMHDVLLPDNGSESCEDRYERQWISHYDAVITCAEEDSKLVGRDRVFVVPNGAPIGDSGYQPSPREPIMLFMGPFRYAPNLRGIEEFLLVTYPRLRRNVPGLVLWILGGHGAPEIAARIPCFDQAGVSVMDYSERPREWLDRCALTINPLHGVRGSCVKVIESLCANRVCVSTKEGARGFLQAGFSSLIVTDFVQEFAQPLERLLTDHEYRRSLEFLPPHDLAPYSWEHAANLQTNIYQQWMTKSQTR